MKIYDLVKSLLEENTELRSSDKKLIWSVWNKLGLTSDSINPYATGYIKQVDFFSAPSTETIRRCRQKIQELHPELQSSKRIKQLRKQIEDQRGTFIYREEIEEQTKLL